VNTYRTPGPRVAVEAVDALDCQAPAVQRIGTHCMCDTHRMEIVKAYWATDSNLPIFDLHDFDGWRCGQTYVPKAVAA
jgi:hypothetical protein